MVIYMKKLQKSIAHPPTSLYYLEVENIRGILIHGTEMKVSQYADCTTLLIEEDLNILNYIIRILKWFENLSGLVINNDKTKVVKVGVSRDMSVPWWVKDSFKILRSWEYFCNIDKVGESRNY